MTLGFIQLILLYPEMDNPLLGTTCHRGKKEVVNVTPLLM